MSALRALPPPSDGVTPAAVTPPQQSDVESRKLVELARLGDREAFRKLFQLHRRDVTRLVMRMASGRTDVEDLVQDVFVQVHRSLPDFRGESKFSTWIHRIAVNVVLMARRAAKSRPVFAGEVSEHLTSEGAWPDDDATRRERMRAFQRCIDTLPDKKRTVFILHDIDGMSAAEIAEVVDAPTMTVRTRLFYARRELCERMKEEPTLVAFADVLLRKEEP